MQCGGKLLTSIGCSSYVGQTLRKCITYVGPTLANHVIYVVPTLANHVIYVGPTLANNVIYVGPMLVQRWPNVDIMSSLWFIGWIVVGISLAVDILCWFYVGHL